MLSFHSSCFYFLKKQHLCCLHAINRVNISRRGRKKPLRRVDSREMDCRRCCRLCNLEIGSLKTFEESRASPTDRKESRKNRGKMPSVALGENLKESQRISKNLKESQRISKRRSERVIESQPFALSVVNSSRKMPEEEEEENNPLKEKENEINIFEKEKRSV